MVIMPNNNYRSAIGDNKVISVAFIPELNATRILIDRGDTFKVGDKITFKNESETFTATITEKDLYNAQPDVWYTALLLDAGVNYIKAPEYTSGTINYADKRMSFTTGKSAFIIIVVALVVVVAWKFGRKGKKS